jgi:hypothetical protein
LRKLSHRAASAVAVSCGRTVHRSGIGIRPDLRAHRRGARLRDRHAGSWIASFAVLGCREFVAPTLTEFAQQAYRINRACKLPLLVDANRGYGNALNVKYTVEELGTAGVAPASIKGIASPELMELVTRQADYSKWSKDFLNAALSGG